jgi:very-short-patch-repair endonuclease
MWLFAEQEFQRGLRGIAILRGELKKLTGTEHLTTTFMESMFMSKVAKSKLPFPTPQFPVVLPSQQAYFDFAYPGLMLAIELDSRAWHDGLVSSKDSKRKTEAEMLGWKVLTFTWGQIMYDWEYVEGAIRHFLRELDPANLQPT